MADFYIPKYSDQNTSGSSGGGGSSKSSKDGFYSPSYSSYEKSGEASKYSTQKLKDDQKKKDEEAARLKEAGKSPLDHIGDFLGGAAGFASDIAKSTAEAYKRVGEGTAEVLNEVTGGAQKARDQQAASSAQDLQMIRSLGDRIKNGKTQEEKDRARSALDKIMKIGDQQSKDFQTRQNQIIERTDPVKGAGAVGSIGLDIATAGVGGVAANGLVKGGIKVGEEGLKTVIKGGLKTGIKKVAKQAGEGAAIGAGYGITGTAEDKGGDAKVKDYALNAAFGAGVGAALPVAGAALKKGAEKVVGALKGGKTAKVADKSDLNATINQAIDEQSGKYDTGVIGRVKNAIGDAVDPLREFAKIDNEYAKTNGIKRSKLNADESLEDLARRSAAAEREAAGLFEQKTSTGQSARDLVEKYDGDSELGKEFNNYTNAKFDLEFREKNGDKKAIQQNIPTEDLKKFVDEYEVRNPDATKDLSTKKAINDMAVDYMQKSGVISKEEAHTIKTSYKNAVPLERVFPDDLARPEVTGRNIGSIAKQTVIQKLEGGSDIPLSNSFDTMLNRVYKAVGQGNRAKLAQKLLERNDQGLVKGSKVLVEAGNKEARNVMREHVQVLNKGLRTLDSKVKVSNRQMRKIQSELDKLSKQGLDINLKEGGKTPLPDMNVGKLSKLKNEKGKTTSSRAFFKSLVEADPAHLQTIRNKIATREPKLAAKLDEVANLRTQMDAYKGLKQDFKDVTAEFVDDPTTGKQVISGVIDGQTYKMEVPPELAKAVQGLDQQKLPSVLKAFAIAKKPFEVTWTGVLNPVFSAISAVFYDTPMSIINSPQGFKTIGPKAMIEAVRSIKSSTEFQRALAKEGVRPYGGSGASSFIKPDAKSLAAQRNILTNIKYTSTHPEVALSKLDIWGGKLANMTRTRVARAAYDDALRMAKKAGENVKDVAVQKRAMENAALAYRTIMPDFDTMSQMTRQINSVVPFYAASVAGTRSFGKALKRDPLGTGAKALALGIAPTVGLTAFSLMQPAGQAFYKDMEDSGQTRTLDDNMVIVLPGAHKDDKTGDWTGIIKVPLAPEFRALNQTAWRSVRGAMGGDGPTGSQVALSLFDAVTGGVRSSENPLVATRRILSGEDPRTGEQIVKGDMANLPKMEQVYEAKNKGDFTTSEAGKFVAGGINAASKFIGGKDVVSPIQADKLLGQVGLVGSTAKNGGDPVKAVSENVGNRFQGAYGEKASNAFYDTYSPVKSRRDKVSREVTDLIQQNKLNEARRKSEEFNDSLTGSFSKFNDKYGKSDAIDPGWEDMMKSLFIKTGDASFKARARQ